MGLDIGTLSLIVLLLMLLLLAIGMPLGLASAFLAVVTLYLKFGPDFLFGDFGRGMLGILSQSFYGVLMTPVLISVPLFIFMANLLERAGIAEEMYSSLNVWLNRTRGGIAIVTSIMAVIMAAMSGIIGGEVVLLGLIALPQMLRLGYNQNLAIGTICASGSLGTMIPPSIVLIIYGLITETSIKALFTAAFLPGFMLATFIIIYIIIRTQLDPDQAPLPEPGPEDMATGEKWAKFTGFLSILVASASAILLARALFLTVTGQNVLEEGVEPITLGQPEDIPWIGGTLAVALAIIFLAIGVKRTLEGWELGKGLVAPLFIIFVVLGSIYGGITGITEAAAMGATAVFVIALIKGRVTTDFLWDSVKRTIKSTGTIIFVTLGAAALAGCGDLGGHSGLRRANGGGLRPADHGRDPGDDAAVPGARRVHGLGGNRAAGDADLPADCAGAAGRGDWLHRHD